MNCKYCNFSCTKKGINSTGKQRYQCKKCKRYQQDHYTYKSCKITDKEIVILHNEGCGIRSISRILGISPTTTISRRKIGQK